jgi:mono/diheme cytochrome c family protein
MYVPRVRIPWLAVALVACGTDAPSQPKIDWAYPSIAGEPQRAGDPAKGYDYLVNGGYITCGIPKDTYDQVFGSSGAAEQPMGRTGDNAHLPYYYSVATSAEGIQVVTANCLECHAGHIDGKLVVGLGGADRDFTSNQAGMVDDGAGFITDPTAKAEYQRFTSRIDAIAPYTQTLTVGVNPADNLTAALMAHRDPVTLGWSDTPRIAIPQVAVAPVDVPPWWRMKKKTTMFYDTAGRGDHARIMMAASLLCTDSVDEARAIDAAFVDVRAWIETMSPPKWPWAIDSALAAKGRDVFNTNCATCHGTYGAGGTYPNELVPLADVGTDPVLASGTAEFADASVKWFAASFWGETSRLDPQIGYLAPPLDGIWATAPYFHNGSVPTLAAVLDSSQRPSAWTRSFDSTDYDRAAVGWQFTAAPSHAMQSNNHVYDTAELGYGNGGHTYGDFLDDSDRSALLEYLKTL